MGFGSGDQLLSIEMLVVLFEHWLGSKYGVNLGVTYHKLYELLS